MGYDNLVSSEEIQSAQVVDGSDEYTVSEDEYTHTIPDTRKNLIETYRKEFHRFERSFDSLLNERGNTIAEKIYECLEDCSYCSSYELNDDGTFSCRNFHSDISKGDTTEYATQCDVFQARWDSDELPGGSYLSSGFRDALKRNGRSNPAMMERLADALSGDPETEKRRRVALRFAFYEHLATPLDESFNRTRCEAFLRDIDSERSVKSTNRGDDFEQRIFSMFNQSELPLGPRRLSFTHASEGQTWREMDIQTTIGGVPTIIEIFTRGSGSTKGRFLKKYGQAKTYQRIYQTATGDDADILLLHEDFSTPQLTRERLFHLLDTDTGWKDVIEPSSVAWENDSRPVVDATLYDKTEPLVEDFRDMRLSEVEKTNRKAKQLYDDDPETAKQFYKNAKEALNRLSPRVDSYTGLKEHYSGSLPSRQEQTCGDCRYHQQSDSGGFECNKVSDDWKSVSVTKNDPRARTCNEYEHIQDDWMDLPASVRNTLDGKDQRQMTKALSGSRPIPEILTTAIDLAFADSYSRNPDDIDFDTKLGLLQNAGANNSYFMTERDCRVMGRDLREEFADRGYDLLPRFADGEIERESPGTVGSPVRRRTPNEGVYFVDFHIRLDSGHHLLGKVIDPFRKRNFTGEDRHMGWHNNLCKTFEAAIGNPVHSLTVTADDDPHGVSLNEPLFAGLMSNRG